MGWCHFDIPPVVVMFMTWSKPYFVIRVSSHMTWCNQHLLSHNAVFLSTQISKPHEQAACSPGVWRVAEGAWSTPGVFNLPSCTSLDIVTLMEIICITSPPPFIMSRISVSHENIQSWACFSLPLIILCLPYTDDQQKPWEGWFLRLNYNPLINKMKAGVTIVWMNAEMMRTFITISRVVEMLKNNSNQKISWKQDNQVKVRCTDLHSLNPSWCLMLIYSFTPEAGAVWWMHHSIFCSFNPFIVFCVFTIMMFSSLIQGLFPKLHQQPTKNPFSFPFVAWGTIFELLKKSVWIILSVRPSRDIFSMISMGTSLLTCCLNDRHGVLIWHPYQVETDYGGRGILFHAGV